MQWLVGGNRSRRGRKKGLAVVRQYEFWRLSLILTRLLKDFAHVNICAHDSFPIISVGVATYFHIHAKADVI
jgi:hypothetical protein